MAEGDSDGKAGPGTPIVFVSYATSDTAVANAVIEALERSGIRCWIAPRDVTAGTSYAGQIIHAIDAARASVLILSKDAAASPHVLRELERSSSKRHPIIALRIDQAPLPADFEYFLNTTHWLDASPDAMERTLPKLIAAVQAALNSPAAVPEDAPTPQSRSPRPEWSRGRLALVAASLVGLALLSVAADRLWLSKRPAAPMTVPDAPAPVRTPVAPAIPDKSVAVLPFVDMSEKKDQEYFADGLSEELIDHLARANNLKVIARTSSFQFKGKNEDMRAIGQQLGVANLLEGSVRKFGKKLRITAQLIRVADGSHLWSQSYDRTLDDIFVIQNQIADAVVQALQVAIQGGNINRGGKQDNIDAYNLVLEGNFHKARYTAKDMSLAIDLFQQAIKLEPDYALAWARLGSAYLNTAQHGWAPQAPTMAKAAQALREALRIDPNLVSVHYTLAGLAMTEWDFAAAQSEIERIQQIDPSNNSMLPSALADMKGITGDLEGAITIDRQLAQRDPLDTYILANLSTRLLWAQHFEESATISRRLIQLDSTFVGAQSALGFALIYMGRSDDALQAIQQEADEASRLSALPIVYWALGRHADSNAALDKYSAMHATDDAFGIAEIHAYRGEFDLALEWLERAYRQHEGGMSEIRSDLFFRGIAGDPRFKALQRKMMLPEQ
jgi:TolB-like protein/Flp pilus assembly protein TadD